MGERAQKLAERFEQANNDVIAAVERCSPSEWRSQCVNEGRSVGVMAHHIGGGHTAITQLMQAIANGQPLPPLTPEMLDQSNAQHAAQFANCTKDEALALLREGGAHAAGAVRGLSDEQLDRTATVFGMPMSAQQFIENVLIGHPQGHLQSIRMATPA